MKTPTLWRLSAALGVAGSLVMGFGSLTMAAGRTSSPIIKIQALGKHSKSDTHLFPTKHTSGDFTITVLASGQLQAIWIPKPPVTGNGETVTLYEWINPTDVTLKGVAGGTMIPIGNPTLTNGSYKETFPKPDGWGTQYEVFQMVVEKGKSSPPFGQLPEVPWAAALPLLMVLPWGVYAAKQRRQARS